MGIIAWIVLGLGAGLLANMLIPNIKNVAADPGGCTRETFVAARQVRSLSLDAAVPARAPKDGEPQENYSPPR